MEDGALHAPYKSSGPTVGSLVVVQGAIDEAAEDLADTLLASSGELNQGVSTVRRQEQANLDHIPVSRHAGF
jgi:hypothetical protein